MVDFSMLWIGSFVSIPDPIRNKMMIHHLIGDIKAFCLASVQFWVTARDAGAMAYAHGKPLPQAGRPGSAVRSKKWKLWAIHGDMQTYLLIESAKKSWFGTETEAFCEYVCKLVAWEYCIAMFPCFHMVTACLPRDHPPRDVITTTWGDCTKRRWAYHGNRAWSFRKSEAVPRAPRENGEFSPTNNGDLWWFIL